VSRPGIPTAVLALALAFAVALFFLLLAHALSQGFHQLVEAAHGLDLRLFLIREELVGNALEPFGGNVGDAKTFDLVQTLEHMAEDLIEAVQVLLVLHQGGPGQEVEVLHRTVDDRLVQGFHEHQVFLERHRDLGVAQLGEETHEHGRVPL